MQGRSVWSGPCPPSASRPYPRARHPALILPRHRRILICPSLYLERSPHRMQALEASPARGETRAQVLSQEREICVASVIPPVRVSAWRRTDSSVGSILPWLGEPLP